MKVFKKISLIFLVVMLSFFIILWLLFITDKGILLILRIVTSHISGLKVDSVSGNFINGITIKNLYYEKDNILIQSSELYIAFDLSHLLNRCFCVRTLFFRDLFVRIELSQFKKVFLKVGDSNDLIRIIKMYPIIFRHIILQNIHFVCNGMIFKLSRCTTGLIWDRGSFIISSTFFSGLQLSDSSNFMKVDSIFPIIERMSFQNVLSHKLVLSHILKFLSSTCFFQGKSIKDIISHTIVIEKIDGENLFFLNQEKYFIKKLCMQGIISKESIQLALFNIRFPNGNVCVKGGVEFNEVYSVNLIIDCFLRSIYFGEEKINFIISGSFNTTLCIFSKFSGLLNGNLILDVNLTEVGIPLMLMLHIDSLYCSFMDSSNCLIKELNFNLHGNCNDDYQLDVNFFVLFSQLSLSYDVTMHAIGNMNGLVISSLNLKNLTNNISITGSVNYQDYFNWYIHLILKKIDITECVFIWPINLCGEINMRMSLSGGILKLKLFDIYLYGKMKNCYSVNIRGFFVRDILGSWTVPELFLSVGSNILKVSRNFKDKSVVVITTTINFVSINDIFPNLHGSVYGSIDIFQFPEYFNLLINVFAESFCWTDNHLKINRLSMQSNLQYRDILQGILKCELDNLIYYSTFFSKIIFHFSGDVKNHNMEFAIYTNLLNIIVNVHGSMDFIRRNWCGSILKITCRKNMIDLNYIFDKRLVVLYHNLPDQLVFCSDSVLLNNCMLQFSRNFSLREYSIQRFVEFFRDIHLTIKQSFFLRSSKFTGIFILCSDLFLNKSHCHLQGKVSLSCKEIEWISILQNSSMIVFNHCDINCFFNLNVLRCNWLIETRDYGQCRGILKVSLFNQYKLLGNIYGKNISLLFFNVFFESNYIVDGRLNCDLKLIGNCFYPKIYGQVELENLIFQGDQIPFVVNSSRLLIYFVQNRAILDGVIKTTRGVLYVIGDMYWKHIRSICLRIHCMGQNVRMQLFSIAEMDVSPVIVLEITPLECIFKGILNVSSAYVEFKKENLKDDKLNISSDEIILTDHAFIKNLNDLNYKNFFAICGNITVNFCDNVRIKFSGLDAKLHGSLRIIQNIHGLELKGYVGILSGNLNIYGQNLLIKKGQLLFSGLTTDNQPYLNIEAVYNPVFLKSSNNLVTNVQITGFMNAPEVKFFSSHTLSQEEAISYFLSGQRLNILNMNINNTIRSVLIKFGLSYTEKFVKKFGKVLGVQDLVLHTDGFGNESQLVFSGCVIRSGLQIKYGFGIFDLLDTIVVRYCIFPNLYLEAVSGKNRTFDLVYRFEY